MTGIELIAAERKRQIEEEGYTAEHDDRWKNGELAMAGACYAMLSNWNNEKMIFEQFWPFNENYWKPSPKNHLQELKKAGALIAAEIDRLLRLKDNN